MAYVECPIGKRKVGYDFAGEDLKDILLSRLEDYIPAAGEVELVEEAVKNPIGSLPLCELARGKLYGIPQLSASRIHGASGICSISSPQRIIHATSHRPTISTMAVTASVF